MGAMPAHRLTEPRHLGFTPRIRDVLSALDSDGKSRMLDQLFEAFSEAVEHDDLTPINHVIETWYRSKLFAERGEPFFDEFRQGFADIINGEEGATLEEVREQLGLDLSKRPKRS